MINARCLLVLVVSVIILTSGCLFSRGGEQLISIKIDGIIDNNSGYVLIPALLYGFRDDDIRVAKASRKLADDWGWPIEDISGIFFMNISLRYDFDLSRKIKDPEPAYFREPDFDIEAQSHQISIYVNMERSQNMTLSLYSIHSDDYHWFSSEAIGFIGQGWNSISVFYSLEEA